MKNVLVWIEQNPLTFKSFMVAVLPWVGKVIFAATGKTASMGQWGDILNQAINVLVYVISAYGVGGAIVHVARGPALTDVDQAATIVAALKAPPIPPLSEVVAEVKTVSEAVVAVAPVAIEKPLPGGYQRF
jgi:hypothetical protein